MKMKPPNWLAVSIVLILLIVSYNRTGQGGRIFASGQFPKITEEAKILGLFFPTVNVMSDKKSVELHFGRFFKTYLVMHQ
jgi:hypothetical protein